MPWVDAFEADSDQEVKIVSLSRNPRETSPEDCEPTFSEILANSETDVEF